jgi:hypothetical protein
MHRGELKYNFKRMKMGSREHKGYHHSLNYVLNSLRNTVIKYSLDLKMFHIKNCHIS